MGDARLRRMLPVVSTDQQFRATNNYELDSVSNCDFSYRNSARISAISEANMLLLDLLPFASIFLGVPLNPIPLLLPFIPSLIKDKEIALKFMICRSLPILSILYQNH